MTGFDDREKGFEAKYRHDQEIQFKVTARRNKLLGLWAADLMGITGETAEAYARDVIASDFEEPGDDDVVRKVLADLTANGVDASEHKIRMEMEKFENQAREQISTAAPPDKPEAF